MKTALFIDFEDSFSYNVVQEISELNLKVDVINWKDFSQLSQHDLLVLGPGPGHPDDYQRIFPLLERWLSQGKALFGICLGHQIFWTLKKAAIIKSARPIHGQKVLIHMDSFWEKFFDLKSPIQVQRYNSLAVSSPLTGLHENFHLLSVDGEVMVSSGKNVITYQFHPESVGTSFRKSFFAPILRDLV